MSSLPSATRRRGLVVAALTAVVSGVSVFLNGYGVRAWSDATAYTTVKNLAAALVIGAAAFPMLRSARLPSRSTWGRLALIGVFGGGIPFILFFQGLAITDPARAGFIHKSLVIWVAILAAPLLAERLNKYHYAAVGLLFAGQATLGPIAGFAWGRGEWMILAATLMWAGEVILIKRLLPEVNPTIAGAARLGVGAVVLACWTLATGGLGAVATAGPMAWAWVAVTGGTLALFVVGWYTALALAPAIDVTAILVPGAVLTAVLTTGFRGAAAPSPIGIAVIAAGLVALIVAGRRTISE